MSKRRDDEPDGAPVDRWASDAGIAGLSPVLSDGRRVGLVEKRHLVLKRLMSERACRAGRELIDVGTDLKYPFFEHYGPTRAALRALSAGAQAARAYPSSYGTPRTRASFSRFFAFQFGVELDEANIMVTTGASQAFDALSRALAGRFVVVPEFALNTVRTIATANGAEVLVVALDGNGLPDLAALTSLVGSLPSGSIKFFYLNSPTNPTGAVASLPWLRELTILARDHDCLVVHDHDSWLTTHEPGLRSANILEAADASCSAVTIISVSKEFGLPGLRIGFVAGKAEAINLLRIHNSEYCVMLPEFCQNAAAAAIDCYVDNDDRCEIQMALAQSLESCLLGWRSLGWPESAVHRPRAGYKFLVDVPPAFQHQGAISGVELFDFVVARDAAVKLSTARSFNDKCVSWVRMVLMQSADVVDEIFTRLRTAGISYRMHVPPRLVEAYQEAFEGIEFEDL